MEPWLERTTKRLQSSRGARLGGALLLVVATAIALVLTGGGLRQDRSLSYTDLFRAASSPTGEIALVRLDGERVTLEGIDGSVRVGVVADGDARHDLSTRFAAAGVPVRFESAEPSRWASALAPLLVVGLAGAIAFGVHRRRSTGHFAASRGTGGGVRFTDVAGMEEAKEALGETVEFLSDPKRFGRLGGRAPRGVLLTGEPGTGKTLLARAVANEAGVPFLSASGSGFQEMFVGVGASRVRSLFTEARRVAPCIVFIDEIDAVGRSRGRGGDSASADHDQTLNQLLIEMDGFDHQSGIVVMASTNRMDVLDPALLRPGRFDRHIVVPLPDARGRKEILEVHARPIEIDEAIDLAHVARATPGFSGADLANLLNEAAILAAREGAERVDHDHIERARDRVMMGAARHGVLIDADERHATAVHEAGHVAAAVGSPHADPVHKVSILPRGRALGVTMSLPERDRLMYRREYLEDQICVMMGGRAAEMVVLGTQTAGASDDIQRATGLARKMVAELGMSDLGAVSLGDAHTPRSQALLDRIEDATHSIVTAQLDRACRIVGERRAAIDRLVAALLAEDTVDAAQIEVCFRGSRTT